MGLLLFWHGLPLVATVPEFSLGLAGAEVPLSQCDCTLSVSQQQVGLEMRTVSGALKRDLLAARRQWTFRYTWLPGKRGNVHDNGMGRDDLLALFYATVGLPDVALQFHVPAMDGNVEEVAVQFGSGSWREGLLVREGPLGSVYDVAFSLVEVTDARVRTVPSIPALWYLAGAVHEPEHVIAVYAPKSAISQAASYVNLVNPGLYNAGPGVAPGWTADHGWVFDGLDDYLLTGIPMVGNDYTVICRYANFDTGSGLWRALFGWHGGEGTSDMFLCRLHNVDNKPYYLVAGGARLASTDAGASGVMALTYDAGYRDGIVDGVLGDGEGTNSGTDLAIGAELWAGSPHYYCPADVTHLAVYDKKLTPTQIAAISAAVAVL